MGTPEFPDLGKHCTFVDCKQIDFLPFTCDRCSQLANISQLLALLRPLLIDASVGKSATMVMPEFLQSSQAVVFCLEHRSYLKHSCPKADKQDVTVVICPLCAKGVRLIPDEDPNITWETHVNTECDPSNFEKVKRKKKCPVPYCREILTFSNTIKCRDCLLDHCLKHRFGPDHKCSGPKKPEAGFPFLGLLSRSRKEESKLNQAPAPSSPKWTSFLNAASTMRASAEAGMAKLSTGISQKLQIARDGMGQSSSPRGGSGDEQCPQCGAKFSSVTTLVEHVEKVHERSGSRAGVNKVTIDVCPKCSRGFRDPVSLVEHVERDHGGSSRA
ncbi:Zinc finger AN1 and C2H2 domain-containing stress-associated protein 16 [Morella rubra]|uniref:Zinc finger AN1 and C2H2 domain-containing stress-associated protein 16 n=1 Tax=Morella rubra TaxID=262757 RepID=A0A6A1ULR9_9ROSI|nr:Zinc finger AN1 and C2H2 domain-containing stress-associated protein 16 [Morella rubra]